MILNKQFITLKIILLELFSPFFKTKICAILHSWSSMLVLGCLFFFFLNIGLSPVEGEVQKDQMTCLLRSPRGCLLSSVLIHWAW